MLSRSRRELEDLARRYDERRARISAALTGRPKSEKHRRHMAEAARRAWVRRKAEASRAA